jgi:hypothetical protein
MAVADHLKLMVQSLADKDISNMSAYYTITDVLSGKMEGRIVHLKNFVLNHMISSPSISIGKQSFSMAILLAAFWCR